MYGMAQKAFKYTNIFENDLRKIIQINQAYLPMTGLTATVIFDKGTIDTLSMNNQQNLRSSIFDLACLHQSKA